MYVYTTDKVDIYHKGEPYPFSSDCLVIETKKKQFAEFSSRNKPSFHTSTFSSFYVSPLNDVSNLYFLKHNKV